MSNEENLKCVGCFLESIHEELLIYSLFMGRETVCGIVLVKTNDQITHVTQKAIIRNKNCWGMQEKTDVIWSHYSSWVEFEQIIQ